MICGLKWKTCNCPWFNYDQVENDRLEHMRPLGHAFGPNPERARPFLLPPRPRAYNEERDARRRQEIADEEFARMLATPGHGIDNMMDFRNIGGIGNARAHPMNDDYGRP